MESCKVDMKVAVIQPITQYLSRFALQSRGGFFVLAMACAGGVSAADLSRHEGLFLRHVAEGGYTEVEASKLAQTRLSSPEVKKFAAALIADQDVITTELGRLALAKGVILPLNPNKMQRATILKLSKLSGIRFDKEFSREIGVLAHKDRIALFEQAQKRAKDADVKEFAIKTLPMLEQQLTQGQLLKLIVDKRKVRN